MTGGTYINGIVHFGYPLILPGEIFVVQAENEDVPFAKVARWEAKISFKAVRLALVFLRLRADLILNCIFHDSVVRSSSVNVMGVGGRAMPPRYILTRTHASEH